MKKVFVYGTLKKGRSLNPYYMENSKYIKQDTVKGELYSLGSYPALVEGKEDVPGEIFEMPIDDFEKVKKMEEDARYFTQEVETESGIKVMAFFQKSSDINSNIKIKIW